METHPHELPHRPGYTVVHVHDETGEPCTLDPHIRYSCRYVPTLRTRLRWTLARLFQ